MHDWIRLESISIHRTLKPLSGRFSLLYTPFRIYFAKLNETELYPYPYPYGLGVYIIWDPFSTSAISYINGIIAVNVYCRSQKYPKTTSRHSLNFEFDTFFRRLFCFIHASFNFNLFFTLWKMNMLMHRTETETETVTIATAAAAAERIVSAFWLLFSCTKQFHPSKQMC